MLDGEIRIRSVIVMNLGDYTNGVLLKGYQINSKERMNYEMFLSSIEVINSEDEVLKLIERHKRVITLEGTGNEFLLPDTRLSISVSELFEGKLKSYVSGPLHKGKFIATRSVTSSSIVRICSIRKFTRVQTERTKVTGDSKFQVLDSSELKKLSLKAAKQKGKSKARIVKNDDKDKKDKYIKRNLDKSRGIDAGGINSEAEFTSTESEQSDLDDTSFDIKKKNTMKNLKSECDDLSEVDDVDTRHKVVLKNNDEEIKSRTIESYPRKENNIIIKNNDYNKNVDVISDSQLNDDSENDCIDDFLVERQPKKIGNSELLNKTKARLDIASTSGMNKVTPNVEENLYEVLTNAPNANMIAGDRKELKIKLTKRVNAKGISFNDSKYVLKNADVVDFFAVFTLDENGEITDRVKVYKGSDIPKKRYHLLVSGSISVLFITDS